jgi:hypothetical protein
MRRRFEHAGALFCKDIRVYARARLCAARDGVLLLESQVHVVGPTEAVLQYGARFVMP